MNIRNFCILAHIDHGKSTLADRFLELTGAVEKRKMREQFLDMHPLEREKGITIKMQPVRMLWHPESVDSHPERSEGSQDPSAPPQDDKKIFVLNLIDTPGHVDFSYEVSRALAAVEGAILLVDATQGVQAQTIANLTLATEEGLSIIPVVNKIDLPSADIEKTEEEIMELLSVPQESILRVSGKTGEGAEALLAAVIERVPPPKISNQFPQDSNQLSIINNTDTLRALVFDSFFDPYQGVIAEVRVVEGVIRKGDRIRFLATAADCEALEIGVFSPERTPVEALGPGEIGYVATGVKEPEKVRVGDTVITHVGQSVAHRTNIRDSGGSLVHIRDVEPLPGYREPAPMVFSSIFPEDQDEYEALREALKKLKLNDAAIVFEPEESGALGRGFRVGFLGMLHMEIVSERLRREYDLVLAFTNPSVTFQVFHRDGRREMVYTASRMPESGDVAGTQEQWVFVDVILPHRFLGPLHTLVSEHEGRVFETIALAGERLRVRLEAPLREIIVDFYDTLKGISEGFASMSYRISGWRDADLVRLDFLIAGDRVPALSEVVPRENAYRLGRTRVAALKEVLPKRLFAIAIQAEVGGRIIARETISALKKDVTGYLYGGDRTRKMKLWKKQQRGKKRLKETGRVDIPADVFLKILRR